MPSREYLEAGKFKLQRGQGSLVDRLGLPAVDMLNAYQARYKEKLQVSIVSIKSIQAAAKNAVTTNQLCRFFLDHTEKRADSPFVCLPVLGDQLDEGAG